MRWRDQALPRAMNRMWDLGLSDLNSTRGALGLPPLAHVWDQVDRAARVLLLTAESFDFPALRPPNVRYVGPVLDDPDWADTPAVDLPPGDEPLVLVGLSGSRIRGGPELLHRVVDGLSLTPFRRLSPPARTCPRPPRPARGSRWSPPWPIVESCPTRPL